MRQRKEAGETERGQLPSPWSPADQWQVQKYEVLARYLSDGLLSFLSDRNKMSFLSQPISMMTLLQQSMEHSKSKVNVSVELWKAAGKPFENTNYERMRNDPLPCVRHQSIKDWHSIASLQNRLPLKAIMNNLKRNPYKILNMHKILAKGLIKYTSPTRKKNRQNKQKPMATPNITRWTS